MRFGVINKDGLVINVIEWEGSEWLPPHEHYVIQSDFVDVGDRYDIDNDILTKINRIAQDPTPQE